MEENWDQYRDNPTSEDWNQYKDSASATTAHIANPSPSVNPGVNASAGEGLNRAPNVYAAQWINQGPDRPAAYDTPPSGNGARPIPPETGMEDLLNRGTAKVGQEAIKGVGTLAKDIVGAPKAGYQMAWKTLHQSPITTVQELMEPNAEQKRKASIAFQAGKPLEGSARYAASKIPILGPMVANVVDEWNAGNQGEAVAHGLEAVAPELMKKLPQNLPWTRKVKNFNNPTEEAAMAYLNEGKPVQNAMERTTNAGAVRMTPGQRGGDVRLQRNERNLINSPGTANEAQEYFGKNQSADLAKRGDLEIADQGGMTTDPVEAGRAIYSTSPLTGQQSGKLVDVLRQQKAEADSMYAQVRADAAKNKQQVQTGTTTTPGPNPQATLTPAGMPTTSPVYSVMDSPMELAPLQAQLRPIYEDLLTKLTDAQKQRMPAFASLKGIMETDKKFMPALDFDQTLGAIKAITRDGASSLLSNQSQGLAKKLIAAGEAQFQAALGPASPDVLQKLQQARSKVKEYHATDDLISSLPEEPAALYRQLTRGGDVVVEKLAAVKKLAPEEVKTIGRTYMEELMRKATAEGGFGKAPSIDTDWHKLPKQTRDLLFEPGVAENMDKFFLGAKRLSQSMATGSATADRFMAISEYGDVGMALLEFIGASAMGHPMAGAVAAGGFLAKTRLQPAILARISLLPAGAELLNQVMNVPVQSAKFNQAMRALQVMAESENSQSGQEDKPKFLPGFRQNAPPSTIPQPKPFSLQSPKQSNGLPPWMMRPPLSSDEEMQATAPRWLPGQR